MATGDLSNMAGRLRKLLPPSWFPDPSTNVWGLLQGFASVSSYIYGQIAFAKLQTRIKTATGFFLDLIAFDFFGRAFQRMGLSDSAFSAAIIKEVLRIRATRAGLIQALIDLTGRAPIIFEPSRPGDTGGYRVGGVGYGVGGAYGSMLMPYQALVIAFRPSASGIPGVDGYGGSIGGYGVGALKYADMSEVIGQVTDAQIYARIASVIPEGTVAWTAIKS